MNKYVVNILRIIALAELILGLSLFFKELNEYMHLPTALLLEEQFGGLVDWFKYKENCCENLFLYALISLTGISFWINIKLYLGLTHMLFITLFFVMIFNLCLISSSSFLLSTCMALLSFVGLVYLEIKILKSSFVTTIKISKTCKWLFFILGIISCCLWLFLKV